MGLGGAPSEWDDYEWVRLVDGPGSSGDRGRAGTKRDQRSTRPRTATLGEQLPESAVWVDGPGLRILLVDLDNLRADPRRWRARMAAVVSLARQADHVLLAGQVGAVERARPHLEEFTSLAQPVADGSDLADYVLLEGADAVHRDGAQTVVLSNDGVFASLADRGPLTVLSPGGDALSDRLRAAATRVIDLAVLEKGAY